MSCVPRNLLVLYNFAQCEPWLKLSYFRTYVLPEDEVDDRDARLSTFVMKRSDS